jgi:hypothetical protein
MVDHEAMCVVRGEGQAVMTAVYRNGEKHSVFDSLAIEDLLPDGGEISQRDAQMLDVARPTDRPCVRLSLYGGFTFTDPDQVYALAQWLVAASMQLATDTEMEEF